MSESHKLAISIANKWKQKHLWMKHSEETKKKISISNLWSLSSQWKWDEVGYMAIHNWLRDKFWKSNCCENPHCQKKSIQYQYALIQWKEYERKRENFIMLCRSCHKKMDMTDEIREKCMVSNLKNRMCEFEWCKNKHHAKWYCWHHYNIITLFLWQYQLKR